MTDYNEQNTKALLEFAGVWKAEEKCPDIDFDGTCYVHMVDAESTFHAAPMPALTGDFRDHVAMECLRRLSHEYTQLNSNKLGRFTFALFDDCDFSLGQATADDPADAIFAAVLAYLKEQEGK